MVKNVSYNSNVVVLFEGKIKLCWQSKGTNVNNENVKCKQEDILNTRMAILQQHYGSKILTRGSIYLNEIEICVAI